MSSSNDHTTPRPEGARQRASWQDRFQSLARATGAIVWCAPPTGRDEEGVRTWSEFTGQSPAEVADEGWAAAIHPDERAEISRLWYQAASAREPFEATYRVRRHDGVYRTMHLRVVPVLGDDGQIVDWVGLATDDTEERFRGYFEQTLVGAMVTGADTALLEVNQATCDLLGYSREELLDRTWVDLTHPDDLAMDLARNRRILAGSGGDALRIEKRFVRKDGSTLHADLGLRCLRKPDGSVDYFLALFSDVSERKSAEAALRESEERYRGLFEHSPFGAAVHQIVLDDDGRPVDYVFLEVNPAFETATGLRTADIVGRRVTEVLPGIEESGFIEVYGKVALSGKPTTFMQHAKPLGRSYSVSAYSLGSGRFATLFEDVTERRRLQKELDDERQRFIQLVENSGEAILLTQPDGAILSANPEACRLFGRSEEELVASGRASLADVSDPRLVSGLAERERTGRTSGELRLRRGDGTLFTAAVTSRVFAGHDGVERASVVVHDLTERLRTETANARLAAIVESSDDAILSKTLDGTILTWNQGAERLYGYAADEVVGEPVTILSPADDEEEMAALLERVRHGASVKILETKRVRKDGSLVDVSLSVSPIKDAAGSIIGASTIARDIAERKQAEEALRASEARFRGYFEQSLMGSVVVSPRKRFIDVNQAFLDLIGLNQDELVGTSWLELTHPDDLAADVAGFDRVVAGQIDGYRLEKRLVRKDGSLVDVDMSVRAVHDHDGAVEYLLILVSDITERRRADEEIRRLNADLEQRVVTRTAQLEATNGELEAFAYSVSHDLRAPLRAIDGFSQAVIEDAGDKLAQEDMHHLQRVREAAQRMAVLIDDLLGLSRVGRQDMRLETVDVSALAEEILGELRESQPDRAVETVVAPHLSARADPVLLRVILANLLGNAWKFTGKHATARIEVGVSDAGGDSAFFVRDDGAGFDPKNAVNLFGAFQRMHSPGEFEGNGIGLATVQRLVARHGGRVWADAAVEEGATFFFTLPDRPA